MCKQENGLKFESQITFLQVIWITNYTWNYKNVKITFNKGENVLEKNQLKFFPMVG